MNGRKSIVTPPRRRMTPISVVVTSVDNQMKLSVEFLPSTTFLLRLNIRANSLPHITKPHPRPFTNVHSWPPSPDLATGLPDSAPTPRSHSSHLVAHGQKRCQPPNRGLSLPKAARTVTVNPTASWPRGALTAA
jgi:hypothetical protein